MAELIVYEKRTCTTCRRLAELPADPPIDFDRVGTRPADALRRREPPERVPGVP